MNSTFQFQISVIREGNASKTIYGLPSNLDFNCHFHGKVVSHGNVSAAISNCHTLMGTIVMDDHFLVIQTIPERLKAYQVNALVLQRQYWVTIGVAKIEKTAKGRRNTFRFKF